MTRHSCIDESIKAQNYKTPGLRQGDTFLYYPITLNLQEL